jgi:hypothetical protein
VLPPSENKCLTLLAAAFHLSKFSSFPPYHFCNMKIRFALSLLLLSSVVFAQTILAPMTVEKIMRDQKWIGSSPSNPYWTAGFGVVCLRT